MFTNSHLQGTYTFNGNGWGGQAPLAAIGSLTFDGTEQVTGLTLYNLPADRFGERKFLEHSVTGTYKVNPNGTGTILLVNGINVEFLFAITQTEQINNLSFVREFSFVVRELDSVTGNMIAAIATRLPDEGAFTNASLRGTYIGTAIGRSGQMPGAGFGILTYDGNGRFSESNVSNVQVGSFRDREFVVGSDQGIYTVNANGTGSVANGGVIFIITKAEAIDGIKRALEYAFIVANLVPANGCHFTGISKRRSD